MLAENVAMLYFCVMLVHDSTSLPKSFYWIIINIIYLIYNTLYIYPGDPVV